MTPDAAAFAGLRLRRPEWAPWLAVVEAATRDVGHRAWAAAVPIATPAIEAHVPRLSGASVAVDVRAIRTLLHRLIDVASRCQTPQMATLSAVLDVDPDVISLFKASVCQDATAIAGMAGSFGADAGAFEAVVALVAVPFLQACNRQWAATAPPGWQEGYCFVCGAWPAFAEVRGIERSRVFRCGRCGGEWHARPLCCAYCGLDDHNALVSLVPEQGDGANALIEGCTSCRGYVKTLTRLQGCSPDTVMLDDLAGVHLDVAALEHGYTRPAGPGYRLDVTVAE